MNAEPGEIILLPDKLIKFKYLIISKPMKIKGVAGTILEITEGPIIINIEQKFKNEYVIFSELLINFNLINEENNPNLKLNKYSYLFKLFPGSLLEIEDCDISCKNLNQKTKIICIQVNSKISYKNQPSEGVLFEKNEIKSNSRFYKTNKLDRPDLNIQISILTLRCSKITNFNQSLRAGENSIIEIEKCFINNNLGKAIVILNPIITKIVESKFESNMENAIQIKFLKDEFISLDKRMLFFEKNEISYNYGSGIYIEGMENFYFDINISVIGNNFKKNSYDGLYLSDLHINSLIIDGNNFKENKCNGLNLQKLNKGGTNTSVSFINNNLIINHSSSSPISINAISQIKESPLIIIKNNLFFDSEGCGVFINDCRAIFYKNDFLRNKLCGLMICNINFYELYKETKSTKSTNFQNSPNLDQVTSYIESCNFIKNGKSGIKIYNYSFNTVILNSKSMENCEFGLHIENENYSDTPLKGTIKNAFSKTSENNNTPSEFNHVYLKNSKFESNMKSGICLIYNSLNIENTLVSNNIDYAIFIPHEENQKYLQFKDKSVLKMIHGNIGGPWGEMVITKNDSCIGCSSSNHKIKKMMNSKIILESPNSNLNPTETIQNKVDKIEKKEIESNCVII